MIARANTRSGRPHATRGKARPIARPSLGEEVYELIKGKIITLDYRPGQCLNESTICNELSVGRTPVHEAMHRLKYEGLVEIIPRKGIVVRPDTLNEMVDLLDARALTEPYCSGLAAERASQAQIEELSTLLAEGRRHLSSRSMNEFMQNDRAFHCRVSVMAGNRVLNEMLPVMHDRSGRIWHLQGWSDQDFKRSQSEHEAILAAIRGRNRAKAAQAMQQHLISLRRRILER